MKRIKNIVLVIVAMALAPGWALAQNGVVLINQAVVAASGGNRSNGGFPYTITQPGSYQLSGNLTVPANSAGIVISASFVSLDLNGFTIRSSGCGGQCMGISDNFTPQSGTTIRNGTVIGFYYGLGLGFSTGSLIEKVRVQSNTFDGIYVGNSSTVRDCIALNNGFDGIAMTLDAIVSGSLATGNGQYGIDVSTGTLTGNTANSNSAAGIVVGTGNSTLTGNSASNNGNFGFIIGPGSTVTGNTASSNVAGVAGFSVNCPSNLIGNSAVGGTPEFEQPGGGVCNKVNNLGF